jgi:hypothetical protein
LTKNIVEVASLLILHGCGACGFPVKVGTGTSVVDEAGISLEVCASAVLDAGDTGETGTPVLEVAGASATVAGT